MAVRSFHLSSGWMGRREFYLTLNTDVCFLFFWFGRAEVADTLLFPCNFRFWLPIITKVISKKKKKIKGLY